MGDSLTTQPAPHPTAPSSSFTSPHAPACYSRHLLFCPILRLLARPFSIATTTSANTIKEGSLRCPTRSLQIMNLPGACTASGIPPSALVSRCPVACSLDHRRSARRLPGTLDFMDGRNTNPAVSIATRVAITAAMGALTDAVTVPTAGMTGPIVTIVSKSQNPGVHPFLSTNIIARKAGGQVTPDTTTDCLVSTNMVMGIDTGVDMDTGMEMYTGMGMDMRARNLHGPIATLVIMGLPLSLSVDTKISLDTHRQMIFLLEKGSSKWTKGALLRLLPSSNHCPPGMQRKAGRILLRALVLAMLLTLQTPPFILDPISRRIRKRTGIGN